MGMTMNPTIAAMLGPAIGLLGGAVNAYLTWLIYRSSAREREVMLSRQLEERISHNRERAALTEALLRKEGVPLPVPLVPRQVEVSPGWFDTHPPTIPVEAITSSKGPVEVARPGIGGYGKSPARRSNS